MFRRLLFVILTSFLAFAPQVKANDFLTSDSCFAHIDSNLYVVNERMPRFVEEVYVGEISPSGYDVQLCYPEFQAVSGKELRQIRQLQKEGVIPSDEVLDANGVILMPSPAPTSGLDLMQKLLVERKKGYLNISFCPVVRHEGVWKRILSCQVKVKRGDTASKVANHAPTADERWTKTSVLASGKWVKVSVPKEGIYQLTAADIQKMGFNDLSKVKVYGYGGLIQNETFDFPAVDENVLQTTPSDDLAEVPVMATTDGRLLFWAEGTMKYVWNEKDRNYTHEQNCYSTSSYYFITENDNPRSHVTTLSEVEADDATVMSDVPYVAVYDNDEFSWYDGGRRMFDGYCFSSGSNHTYRLSTPGLNFFVAGTKSIEVAMGASSLSSESNFSIKANDKNVGTLKVATYYSNNESACVTTKSFSNISVLSGTESNLFQFTANTNNKARLDYIRVNYPRHLQLTSEPYSFSPQTVGPVSLLVDEATSTTHLWRIGQNGSPTAEIPTHLNENVLQGVVPSGKRRFVFFDETQNFAAPTFVQNVENQNLHADENVDYVIIVPANGKLVAQATRLGEIHKQRDGLNYRVVRADQLYNEFSSGTPDANAYRRYLKMLYDRAGEDEDAMPQYCLFMGRSLWDNRFLSAAYKGKNQDDYLLCYEYDSRTASVGSVYSYVTDDFFGMLDDGEGVSVRNERLDVALGRMVCASEEEAKLLVDKTERYINNEDTGSWKNTIAVLGDDGNYNNHMKDSERVIGTINTYAPNFDIQKVYWDRYYWTASATGYTYPQGTARIHQIMTEGALLYNYSGHGSPNIISHYKLLQTPDFAKAWSPHLGVWLLASCEIYPFDNGENNLAETSLYVPDGGSVAFICATRAVFSDRNNAFNCAYSRFLFEKNAKGRYNTLGESMCLAKKQLILDGEPGDGANNKLKYVCFGDPALSLAFPQGKVVLDSINGKAINQMTQLEVLAAGSAARFSGHVCVEDSDSVDESFSGNVSAIIYDVEEEVICKNNQVINNVTTETCDPFVYKERSKSIFKGSTKATNGRFEITAVIPRDISYTNKAGRISLYAVKSDNSAEYNGYSETFCLNGTSDMAEPDTKGPEVIAYINSIDNPDYTITDENPILIADISDDYGINNAGISLGHDIELVLDGKSNELINLNSYFNYDFGSYQKGQLVYPMNGIERGQHTAELRVWDVNNNVTITDVHFIVRGETPEGGRDGYVTSTKNPASTATKFITYFPADVTVEGLVTYEVYDTRGRCVYKQPVPVSAGSTSSSLSWDLCGNDHEPLPSGIYFYRTVVNTSNGAKATDAQKLIITRQ